MEPIRRAVIDVGTNSVKLLVADVAGREVRPIIEQSKQTRLGHGFYETHRLKPDAIAATATAVARFVALANEAQVSSIRVFATSAAREALNREELTEAVERTSGLRVEVISGEQEADWGFQGVTSDPELARASLLLMDVGGGSAQFILGQEGGELVRHSFPLGSVRLLETFPVSDPPAPTELTVCRQWLKDFLRNEVRPQLTREKADGREPTGLEQSLLTPAATGLVEAVQLVGVGGTATILGCMEARLEAFDRARIEATRLTAERVSWHLEHLWSLSLEARKETVGLPKNRADVILMGVAIYHAVMEEFGFRELRISTRGLRFAALMNSVE